MAHLEGKKHSENPSEEYGPPEEESEGNGRLEGVCNENITGYSVGDSDKGIPEMTLPTMNGEEFDQLEGAGEHEDETDERRHSCRRDELVTQGKHPQQDHGNTPSDSPTAGDWRVRKCGKR